MKPTQPVITVPTKQAVKRYIDDRAKVRQPVPTAQEIRRQLGWFLK